MNKIIYIVAILCMIGVTGCASSTFTYTGPSSYEVETERLVSVPFGKFWDMYVAELSKSFFVINNIEKGSRIINVSFSSDEPSEYLDCGQTNGTSSHWTTGKQTFNYKVADSSSYPSGVKGTNLIWHVIRNSSLNGRVNIFMAPAGDQTRLRVNALYGWSVDVEARSNHNHFRQSKFGITFSSNQTGSKRERDTVVQCRSKGILERELLDLAGTESVNL